MRRMLYGKIPDDRKEIMENPNSEIPDVSYWASHTEEVGKALAMGLIYANSFITNNAEELKGKQDAIEQIYQALRPFPNQTTSPRYFKNETKDGDQK